MAYKHVFFSVVQITRSNFAIRYTPHPLKNEETMLQFAIAFDTLIAGENLANKQQSLQTIVDILNAEANKP